MKYINWLTLTTIILTTTPSIAASELTEIDLETDKQGLELKLETNESNSNVSPSFIAVDKGNTLEATVFNTELDIAENFSQNNPFPGIKKITLDKDKEQTKITLVKEADLTLESNIQQQGSELVVNFNKEEVDNSLIDKLPFSSEIKGLKNRVASLVTNKNKNDADKEETKVSDNNQNDDVLVPNPEIIISNPSDGFNEGSQENSYEQPYLPRAVAPPVGDMAVSNINASPDTVDLESSAIVPRLVIRDASVREVLSLLARQAGLNIIFTLGEGGAEGSEEGDDVAEGPTVSLDLENQTVQEAFDSILLISGLNASRRGNTIYIGDNLPTQARNLISRTLRLNQASANNVAIFLRNLGAEYVGSVKPERAEVLTRFDDFKGSIQEQEQETSISAENTSQTRGETGEFIINSSYFKGLAIAVDTRLNTLTLIGESRKVETATAYITQMDARRRQVAVNVKVIDINLLNEDDFNSSFSFGVNDSFFIQDNGAASLRFGESSPAIGIDISNPKKFLALLEATITSGNAKILTDPTLVVQEGEAAVVRLTQEVIKSIDTQIDGESGVRTITPVIGSAGLELGIEVEQIDDNGFVSLVVVPEISSIGASQEFDSGDGAVNVLNLLSTRFVSSGLIRVRDGQTLILSGIIQDQERATVSKVPILGDIPLLGSLFRSTNKTNERAEVIVLLTPEIIDEQADFGYNYQPSKDTREMLRKGGLDLPNNPEQ